MDIALAIIGGLLILAGIIGCLLPILPGPPLSYTALLLLHLTKYADFSNRFLLIMAGITILVTVLDYILPVRLTKKYGGSKAGIRGSTVGLIVGVFFFPPVGIIIGPIIGAFIAEMLHNNNTRIAVRSAVGSFIGFLLATGLKLTSSFIMGYYFVKQLL